MLHPRPRRPHSCCSQKDCDTSCISQEAGVGAGKACMSWTPLMMRVRRARVHLLVLPLSATGAFWAGLRYYHRQINECGRRQTRENEKSKCVVNYREQYRIGYRHFWSEKCPPQKSLLPHTLAGLGLGDISSNKIGAVHLIPGLKFA